MINKGIQLPSYWTSARLDYWESSSELSFPVFHKPYISSIPISFYCHLLSNSPPYSSLLSHKFALYEITPSCEAVVATTLLLLWHSYITLSSFYLTVGRLQDRLSGNPILRFVHAQSCITILRGNTAFARIIIVTLLQLQRNPHGNFNLRTQPRRNTTHDIKRLSPECLLFTWY